MDSEIAMEIAIKIKERISTKLDNVLCTPLNNNEYEGYVKDWISILGYQVNQEKEIEMNKNDQHRMNMIWDANVNLKEIFPGLNRNEDVKEFAEDSLMKYVELVLSTSELQCHLEGFIKEWAEINL